MKSFKDFNITPTIQGFIGDKLKIDKVLNKEITVLDFRIEESKFDGKGKCLHLQIQKGEVKHVVFTGSKHLITSIEQIPKNELPFTTTIVKEDDGRLQFT